MALWASLYIANDIGLSYLYVFGDSLMIINWAKNESTISLVNLDSWCLDTRKLISLFTHMDFSHVFREHNKRADTLSKEGILMAAGQFTFTETCEDEVYREVSLQLF